VNESDHPLEAIPEQEEISWRIAFVVSWAGLRRRVLRSLITMLGIILAIAFLTYMLVMESVTESLKAVNNDTLNVLLQKAGVDVFTVGKTDTMMFLLIGLSLLTCLVGIVNSMLMSITERIKEIGTMKCLGALDSFIVKAYFIESSLQGVFGTICGIVIGMGVALSVLLYSYGRYVPAHFPGWEVAKSVGISFLVGALISIVASIAPAYWAARKEPVDAMRVEE
jgi:ABC-type antimicrobial peptide transport system permease subunit